ncbi:BIRC2 [Bugula neritina]|uniref:BIRC2 n=1 Tax=Bugula neritina TaxID=10212 RepID=A0A7J7KJN1_BUGNE|nr:BIRC2 [Bugula neritina]
MWRRNVKLDVGREYLVRHARQSPNCQLLIREKGHDFINDVIDEHGRYVVPAKEPVINIVTTRMLRPRMDSPAAQAVLDMTDPAYRREDVRAALILNIKYGQSDFLYARDLVAAILKRSEDNEQLNHVRQEIELEIPVPEVVQHPEGADGSEEREMETTEATSSDPTVNEEGEGAQREDGQAMSLMEAPTMPTSGRELQMFFTCKVCLENPLGIVFLPCGHFVCCATCAPAMVQCPLCRQEVRGTVRTTFAHL